MLDAMVPEFDLEFPDFNILKYVDPKLDTTLNVSVLNTVDEHLRQAETNLHKLAGNSFQDCSQHIRCGCGSENTLQNALQVKGELKSLHTGVENQTKLILEMQQMLDRLTKVFQNSTMDKSKDVDRQIEVVFR